MYIGDDCKLEAAVVVGITCCIIIFVCACVFVSSREVWITYTSHTPTSETKKKKKKRAKRYYLTTIRKKILKNPCDRLMFINYIYIYLNDKDSKRRTIISYF